MSIFTFAITIWRCDSCDHQAFAFSASHTPLMGDSVLRGTCTGTLQNQIYYRGAA